MTHAEFLIKYPEATLRGKMVDYFKAIDIMVNTEKAFAQDPIKYSRLTRFQNMRTDWHELMKYENKHFRKRHYIPHEYK